MNLRKWDLAWALLDPTIGHEQASRRPVLVFCNDAVAPLIGLTTVLPLTTWKKGRRVYPTEVLLPPTVAGCRRRPSSSRTRYARSLPGDSPLALAR